jgi:gamma-polyglutamate biosynthesis protein CapC
MVTIESLLIGLTVGFIFYELSGVSPGGVVPPGYLALFLNQPLKIGVTLAVALAVWWIIGLLSRWLILYGRRKLLLAILLGFCLKLGIDLWVQGLPVVPWDIESIGYIIPGLIGHEMVRQRVLPTAAGLGIVTVIVYALLLLLSIIR